jgi:transcriptional regulator with XRE-family HTH domain
MSTAEDMGNNKRKPPDRYTPTHLKAWRLARELSVEKLGELAGTSGATVSRIERGEQPYSQPLLEAFAAALDCDPADILARDPSEPEGVWAIWDSMTNQQKRQAVQVLRALKQSR